MMLYSLIMLIIRVMILTELIEASLTISLDQDTSAPVANDEDRRHIVSRGRVLPFICKIRIK